MVTSTGGGILTPLWRLCSTKLEYPCKCVVLKTEGHNVREGVKTADYDDMACMELLDVCEEGGERLSAADTGWE